MDINTMGMEPLIRLQDLSALSLNMELFSVVSKAAWGVPLGRFSGTHAHFVIWKITLYENSPMTRHFITRWSITATIITVVFFPLWPYAASIMQFRVINLYGRPVAYTTSITTLANEWNKGWWYAPRARTEDNNGKMVIHRAHAHDHRSLFPL